MPRAAIALAAGIALAAAAPAAGAFTTVGVTATEFDLVMSRAKVDPGRGEIELRNAGEDPHDLVVRRIGATRRHRVAEIGPGEVAEPLELRFRPNARYVLWCSLASGQHRASGMEARLRVRG